MTCTNFLMTAAAVALFLGSAMPSAQAAIAGESVAPDNTQVNTRDRNASEMTADKAGDSKADLAVMQNVRQAIANDHSLSTYAQNVKVISMKGHVTLKGPVKSAQESANIEAKAAQVAGQGGVTNQLSVMP